MMKRDEYIAKLKLQLDELDARMNTIEAKAKGAREDAREKFQYTLVALQNAIRAAQGKPAAPPVPIDGPTDKDWA